MLFQPSIFNQDNGFFHFGAAVSATAPAALQEAIYSQLWQGFCCTGSSLTLESTQDLSLTIGSADPLPLDGHAFSIHVTETGVCLQAASEQDLRYGFFALLDMVEPVELEEGKEDFRISSCRLWDRPDLEKRMVHLCIFPETTLDFVHRFVRTCGVLRYTHIVLEFWGTLHYDVMKELSWKSGFTKDQIRPIIAEAKALGLEVIPMFNHWGHAAQSRCIHGKHVVLDQNPRLQTLFTKDGWSWRIDLPKVRQLQKSIRQELMELCGEGSYFHIGCDEAYNYHVTEETFDHVCGFLNEIADELEQVGRRPIMWADMLLYRHHNQNGNTYVSLCESPEIEALFLQKLSKRMILADWQYDAQNYPIDTALFLQKAGYDVIICPWDNSSGNTDACVDTVKKANLYGLLHTTWHTLSSGMPVVIRTAVRSWCAESDRGYFYYPDTAALLRKLWFTHGDFKNSGWSEHEILDRC